MSKVDNWRELAARAVSGLNVQPRELILIRDGSGNQALLTEMMLAIDRLGATPLVETLTQDYLLRLLSEASPVMLKEWDYQRQLFINQADRVLTLGGVKRDFSSVPAAALQHWQRAVARLMAFENSRRLPYLLVAAPTAQYAERLGFTDESLLTELLPALCAPVAELREDIERVMTKLQHAATLTIRTYPDTVPTYQETERFVELTLQLGNRRWLSDDGQIDSEDRRRGATASNLPAGSIYTTVIENKSQGSIIFNPGFSNTGNPASRLQLEFAQGLIVKINTPDARTGKEFSQMLNSNTGHCRRIGHIGIGLNRYLTKPINWTLVDEHIPGAVFFSLGENQYMGGKNRSSLNIDFAITNASMFADDLQIIDRGKLLI